MPERKPLELTVYPIWDAGDGDLYADCGDRLHPKRVDFEVYRKRLNETQLAAEVFFAVFHESECEVKARRLGEGHPAFNHWFKWNHEWARRAEIVERFATYPDYDQEDQ